MYYRFPIIYIYIWIKLSMKFILLFSYNYFYEGGMLQFKFLLPPKTTFVKGKAQKNLYLLGKPQKILMAVPLRPYPPPPRALYGSRIFLSKKSRERIFKKKSSHNLFSKVKY